MTIHLGGLRAANEERIYFKDARFTLNGGEEVSAKRSEIPGVNMADLFARHKARYYLPALFCRPGLRVLDFPCGTGYGTEVFAPFGVEYRGLDIDPVTLGYARKVYGKPGASYGAGDLCHPQLQTEYYDVVACIEGLEHIPVESQSGLIRSLCHSLKEDGVLVVSSPENPSGSSGQSEQNKYHVGELTKADFLALLHQHFPADKVELLTHRATLSTGKRSNCFYGICHK